MPKVTFINHAGQSLDVDIAVGQTLMEGARNAGIEDIVADCGGACACATCHVYIDMAWLDHLPQMEAAEADMLDFAAAPRDQRSRLACQIVMLEEFAGMKVYTPETQ